MYRRELPVKMEWQKCVSCDHVFVSGYWPTEAVEIINRTTFDCQSVGFDMARQRLISAQMVESITAITGFPEGKSWLDIGFGNGALLFTATEYGFRCVGIEIRQALVARMNEIGIEAYGLPLEQLPSITGMDVISMCDVLEHCPFPRETLDVARQRLKPGGLLLLSMPNMDAPVWAALNAENANPYWDEIEHYHNFSRARLYSLLRDVGFSPLNYRASRRYEACMEVIARVV